MDSKRLLGLIDKFRGKKVAVVGDIMLDSYLFGRVERINPERAGYPLLKVEKEEFRLGGAGNVAANLSALGADVSLFGAVGNDIHGAILKRRAKRRRIKLFSINAGKTIVKQRRIEKTHGDYLGREDFGETHLNDIGKKNRSKILEALRTEKPDVLILSDYNKRIFTGDFARELIDWAKRNNIMVLADFKPENYESFEGADLVCPNMKEALGVIGMEYKNKTLKEIVEKVHEILKCKHSIVTCGADGIVSFDGKFNHIPTEAKELSDVTGAGDSVISVLALALASGASLNEAAFLANNAAGIVVEKLGTASVTGMQLKERIRKW